MGKSRHQFVGPDSCPKKIGLIHLHALGLAFCLLGMPAHANIQWVGAGSSGNFSDTSNWFGGNSFPVSLLGNIQFGQNLNGRQPVYDFADVRNAYYIWWTTNLNQGLTLSASAGGRLRLRNDPTYGTLRNESAQLQTVQMDLEITNSSGSSVMIFAPLNGDISLEGALLNPANLRYQVQGTNLRSLLIRTNLGGNSIVGMEILQPSRVRIFKPQTMGSNSALEVRQGELWLEPEGSLATGMEVRVGSTSNAPAKFYLNSSTGNLAHTGWITLLGTNEKTLASAATIGTNTLGGPVFVGAPVLLENPGSGGSLLFSGTLSGTGNITAGSPTSVGKILLSGSNSFTGSLLLAGGRLVASHPHALGSTNGGTTVAAGTTLQFLNANAQNGEVITISGTGQGGGGAILLNNPGTNSLNARINLAADATIRSLEGQTILGTIDTTGSRALTLEGAGGAFSFSGVGVIVGSGSLRVAGSSNQVEMGPVGHTYSGGTTIDSGNILSGAIASVRRNITNHGTISIWTGTSGAFNGLISGSGGLQKKGASLSLELNSAHSYTGTTLVQEGTLLVSHAQGLGTTNGATLVSSGATLSLSNSVTLAESITLGGNGVSGLGALRNLSGSNNLSAALRLSGTATLRSEAGHLVLAAGITSANTDSKTLALDGPGDFTIAGLDDPQVISLEKNGSGTARWTAPLTATNLTVSGGILHLETAALPEMATLSVTGGAAVLAAPEIIHSLVLTSGSLAGSSLTVKQDSSVLGGSLAVGQLVVTNGARLILENQNSLGSANLILHAGSTLAGSGGTTGTLTGSGRISPGFSPGILTVGSLDPASGTDFDFEFTQTGVPLYGQDQASGNDLLRVTTSPPWASSFSSSNELNFYFNDPGLLAQLNAGNPRVYAGGFFVDAGFDLAGALGAAAKNFFIRDDVAGTIVVNGTKYRSSLPSFVQEVRLENLIQGSAGFSSGPAAGTVLQITLIPKSLYDRWAEDSGLASGQADKNADPDGDGWSNALEFAFGMNPGSREAEPFSVSPDGSGIRVVFLARDGISNTVLTATNLQTGFDGTALASESSPQPSSVPPNYRQYEVTLPATNPVTRSFLKIQAQVP